jgi:uncharacterized protein involved in type VI secretion and phage assembly
MNAPFYGKYRGVVTDTKDPLMLGRIKARVPAVTGDGTTGWALPSFPAGGSGMGIFALPKENAPVWIEFEGGDPDYPIWTGCFFNLPTDIPSAQLVPPYQKWWIVTGGGNSVVIDDTPGVGGITLETAAGAKISITGIGIEIDNGKGGKISMVGPQVKINDGALEVI